MSSTHRQFTVSFAGHVGLETVRVRPRNLGSGSVQVNLLQETDCSTDNGSFWGDAVDEVGNGSHGQSRDA